MFSQITVQTTVNAPMEKVWVYWNLPEHITHWAFASDDWECPAATNDLRNGGKFTTTMAAKDKSAQFTIVGTYTLVKDYECIEYSMEDGRKVAIHFSKTPEGIKIVESFDPENENSEEMQRGGWQAILNNFKKYAESSLNTE